MIGGTKKIDSVELGFWQFMSSSTLNNMLLFQGLCVGAGALMFSVVAKEKKQYVGIWIVSLLVIGSIPFIAAETVNAELPESGDIYAFFRGANTKTRDYSTANFTASEVSVSGCGLDTCLLTGKHEIIMSMFPGSMVSIDLSEDASLKPEVVKILVHDFNQRQGLVYDYSQYDYGIGIVEGNTVEDTEAEPVDNWWKSEKFADNSDNYINCPWEVKDYRKLPNNLRSYHFASDAGGQECGSWGNTGDFYSRQVIIPKEEGISFFYAESDVLNNGLFEVIYNGVSHFKTLEEMKNGFELKNGLELMLISHDKPSPKTVRMFCHHKNGTGFGKCFDYNYPALGNPSQQGPGHFQSSRKLTKGVEFTNGNYFFGRTDWKDKIMWFRDGSCDSGAARMSFGSTTESRAEEGKTYTIEEREWINDLANLDFKSIRLKNGLDVSKKIRELRKSGFIDLDGVNKKFIMKGQGNFWSNDEQRDSNRGRSFKKGFQNDGDEFSVFDLFGVSALEERKKILLEMAKSSRSLIAWIIFMLLAAAVVVALTVGLVWKDIKDNCCGINRFGYSDFKNIDSYARPINDSLGAYKPEIEWSGLENLGEPMNNYLTLRETEEVRARFTLTASSTEVKINNDVVTIQSMELKKCDAVMSGSTGSCDIVYETIGAGGMVKLEAKGMKLNNAILNMKSGQNVATLGINSVSFAGSIVEICVAGTGMCSSTTVTFVGKPDGSSGDTLDSGSPFGSPYMTMQEMFENKGFLTTFILVCMVSGILGILMLLTLGYLIKDYVRPNMQGVDMKSMFVLIFLFCVISPAEPLTVFATKNVTVQDVRNAGLSIAGKYAADSWNTAPWSHAFYVLHNNDLPFLRRCSQKMQMNSYEGPGGKVNGNSSNVCTVPTMNTTVIPINQHTSTVPYYFVSPRFMGVSGTYISEKVSMIPYFGQRAVEDRFAFYGGPNQYVYFFEVKTGKWYKVNQLLSFQEITIDPARMTECTEVKWHRYASVCPTNSTLDSKSMNKGLCYGCYGQYLCGVSRADGINHGSNYACIMNGNSVDIATNGTGMAYLTNIGVFGAMAVETMKASESEGYKHYACGNTINLDNIEICTKSTVFNSLGGSLATTLDLMNMKGVTDGVNDFGFIAEFIVNVGISPGNITIVEMCDVLTNMDVSSGPINCIKKDNSMQCVAYCEMMAPVRPGSEIGLVKSEMKAVGARNHKSLLDRSKGKKQKIISELMKKDRKTSRFSVLESQISSRASSNVDYTNMFITYDGVILGMKLGGPHRLSCFYGNDISTFCNSTEGFGWVSGITLKPISGASGQTMYVPEEYIYVTFSLDGQDCQGVLTDVTGELTCDTTCCITSFDDFSTFIHVFGGTRIVPSSRLAISFVDQNLGRSAASSSGKVYPQGVDEYYNTTCARGSDVGELWVCLQEYYPDVFWALMGTIIAFGVTAMILVVWRLGLKNTGKRIWSGAKKTGGWVAAKSKNTAKWISNRIERANISMKITIAKTLIATCNRILKNPDYCTDQDYNKVKLLKVKLEQKLRTWNSKMGAKKIGNNKYEKVQKERGEDKMSIAGLESIRMTLMEICNRMDNMEQEKQKLSTLGKNISKAKEEVNKVKMENSRRGFKTN